MSSSMTVTPPTSGYEALQSVAMELVIFCATIVVALVLRVASFKPGCAPGFLQQLWSPKREAKGGKSETSNSHTSNMQFASDVQHPQASQMSGSPHGRRAASRTQGPANVLETIMDRASNKNAVEALSLYDDLRSSDLQIQALLRSARHSGLEFYSAMVQSAVRAGRPEMVETFLDDMAKSQIERTLSFYESAMKVLAGKKHYRQALAVYNRLKSEGFKASPVTLSCLINFAAELGELDAAIEFFEQLSSTSTPSIRAYMMALRVYSKRQDWSKSLEIFRNMQARGVTIDSLILNSVLATGVAAGKTEATEALLHEAADTIPSIVDTISYNTVLKGYAHQKIAAKALSVLDVMLRRGTKPNGITFNTVMDAAVRGCQTEDAWKTLESMRESGIRPDKYTCTILLKSLNEDSTPKQLSTMIDMIQAALPHCDPALSATLFHSIVEVTARLNNASLLMRAFNQMHGKNIVPTSADYQLIIQTLAQQCSTQNCCIMWRHVLAAATKPVTEVFTAVMEELAKKEKVEGMICAFETLSAVINESEPAKSTGSQKGLEKREPDLLEQCRAALLQAASRKQHSSPAFKRLLELAPEQGLQVENLMTA